MTMENQQEAATMVKQLKSDDNVEATKNDVLGLQGSIQSRRRSHTTTPTAITVTMRIITAAMIPAPAPALSSEDDSS